MNTYKIIRFYSDPSKRSKTRHVGLTLEEAREHCKDPETNSRTARDAAARQHTREYGEWFDGYTKE